MWVDKTTMMMAAVDGDMKSIMIGKLEDYSN